MTLDDRLLDLQQHDDAVDRISRRLASLPEADEVARLVADDAARRASLDALEERRTLAERERQRCDDAIASLDDELRTVSAALDGGAGANPREAAALTSKREMLERNKSELEDAALDAMLALEELAPDLEAAEAVVETSGADLARANVALQETSGALESDRAAHRAARAELVAALDPALVAAYDKSRGRGGAGAARLEAGTCQGCHIALSPDDIGDVQAAEVPKCPECGALLVFER